MAAILDFKVSTTLNAKPTTPLYCICWPNIGGKRLLVHVSIPSGSNHTAQHYVQNGRQRPSCWILRSSGSWRKFQKGYRTFFFSFPKMVHGKESTMRKGMNEVVMESTEITRHTREWRGRNREGLHTPLHLYLFWKDRNVLFGDKWVHIPSKKGTSRLYIAGSGAYFLSLEGTLHYMSFRWRFYPKRLTVD